MAKTTLKFVNQDFKRSFRANFTKIWVKYTPYLRRTEFLDRGRDKHKEEQIQDTEMRYTGQHM